MNTDYFDDQDQNYCFFLLLGESIPQPFFQLSGQLNALGIKLLPVTVDQLFELRKNYSHFHLIAMTYNGETKRRFEHCVRKHLYFPLARGNFFLYHLSSFEQPFFNRGWAVNLKRLNYQFYSLPQDGRPFCEEVARNYYNQTQQSQRWPGGRRGHLVGPY